MWKISKMQMKTISSAVLLSMLFPACAFAATGTAAIQNTAAGTHDYKAVRLTPEIYNHTNYNLSDILLTDENGETIPYFINSLSTTKTDDLANTYALQLADEFVKDGDSYADYFTQSSEQKDIVATRIVVTTQGSTFAKNIELRGSYDGVTWDFIQNDKLYSVDENQKLSIAFQQPLKYTHYRFKLLDNAENISFEKVWLEYSQVMVDQFFFNETITPAFEVEQKGKTTAVKVFGLKNLKLNELSITTASQFKRPVSYVNGRSNTIYNLTFQNASYQDTKLLFNGYQASDDAMEFTIQNGDDKPIQIDAVTVSYSVDEIIFKAQANASYTISYGDETITNPPVYDIANYRELILQEGCDILEITGYRQTASPEMPLPADYTIPFNILIVIIAVLLFFVILYQMRRSKSA